jgi:HK97 family phage portal protein
VGLLADLLDQKRPGALARLTQPDWSGGYSNRVLAVLPGVGAAFITHEDAIKISALWACMRVISEAIGSSTWEIFLEQPNGDRDYMPGSTAYRILNVRPNLEMSPISFHQATVAVALLWGNSYGEIERDRVGRPAAIWPIYPNRCTLERGESGALQLRVTNFGKPPTLLPYADVYHIHGVGLDGTCGLDLVSTAARGLLQAAAADTFGLKYFQHGTAMGGVLSTDSTLDQKELDDIRAQVEKRVSGPENAFRFLVLGSGMKWTPITSTLNEGQNRELRDFMVNEVCRWCGVPPHKIAQLDRATFGNIEHQGIEFQRDALRPWAKRCEQEIDFKVLPAGPITVRCDLEWAAEGDAKSKAETDAILVRNGLLRRNEVRRRRGFNSVGSEGDVLTVESQLTTLEAVANGETAPAAKQPASADPAPRLTEAARALFAASMRRCMRRHLHRAESIRSKTAQEFRDLMDPEKTGQLQYVASQIAETIEILVSVAGDRYESKIRNAQSFVIAAAEERTREDYRELVAAYDGTRLRAWRDIDARADELGEEFAGIVKGAIQ